MRRTMKTAWAMEYISIAAAALVGTLYLAVGRNELSLLFWVGVQLPLYGCLGLVVLEVIVLLPAVAYDYISGRHLRPPEGNDSNGPTA